MEKSSHKSRKRKSSSTDRLTSLENKMSRLIDILTQKEVKAPSPPASVSSLPAHQEPGIESDTPIHMESDSEGILSAPLARQVGPQIGVYDIAGSVFAK